MIDMMNVCACVHEAEIETIFGFAPSKFGEWLTTYNCAVFIFFAIFGNLNDELFLSLGLKNEPYAIIVVFLIFSTVLSFFLMPLISLISRHNEYAADDFGANLSSKEDLVKALLKLANENKSFPYSHKLYIFFYFHPFFASIECKSNQRKINPYS